MRPVNVYISHPGATCRLENCEQGADTTRPRWWVLMLPCAQPHHCCYSPATCTSTGQVYSWDTLFCALLQKLQPRCYLASSRVHTHTPGLNQRHFTGWISGKLTISIRVSPTCFELATEEQPTAGTALPSPHHPVGSISSPSVSEWSPISSRSASNACCPVQSPQGDKSANLSLLFPATTQSCTSLFSTGGLEGQISKPWWKTQPRNGDIP